MLRLVAALGAGHVEAALDDAAVVFLGTKGLVAEVSCRTCRLMQEECWCGS